MLNNKTQAEYKTRHQKNIEIKYLKILKRYKNSKVFFVNPHNLGPLYSLYLIKYIFSLFILDIILLNTLIYVFIFLELKFLFLFLNQIPPF